MIFTRLFKDYGLLWTMIIGALLTSVLYRFAFLMPFFLFVMTVLSYTKIKPQDFRLERVHYVLFVAQWIVAAVVYFSINPFNPYLAQGLALLIITPTATSAAVITMMLGGRIAFIPSFFIPCNVIIAFVAPALIGLIYPNHEAGSYLQSVVAIFGQVIGLLLAPLVIVWFLRFLLPRVHTALEQRAGWTFYFWMIAVSIITANTIHTFMNDPRMTLHTGLLYAVGSALLALLLYYIGHKIGGHYGEVQVEARQAFGQKNTILAIWLAYSFMDPVVSIIASFYVIWQNVLNSIELSIYRKELREKEYGKS